MIPHLEKWNVLHPQWDPQEPGESSSSMVAQGKVPGPSGLMVGKLKAWEDQEEDDKASLEWTQVVTLVQHAFQSGKTTRSFKIGTLVLVWRAEEGKYQGIALREVLHKIISCIIGCRVINAVVFHHGVHALTAKHSCAAAILAAKLVIQLAKNKRTYLNGMTNKAA
jgi:hypothetical protein